MPGANLQRSKNYEASNHFNFPIFQPPTNGILKVSEREVSPLFFLVDRSFTCLNEPITKLCTESETSTYKFHP